MDISDVVLQQLKNNFFLEDSEKEKIIQGGHFQKGKRENSLLLI